METFNEISKLELAAQIIMAPPNQVTPRDRKDAESLFLSLREGAISVQMCRQILETTESHFLMFELARAMVIRLLKEWPKFQINEIRNICTYLLGFPITHSNLPNFVSTEMFHSVAMIIKRCSMTPELIFSDLLSHSETLLNSENQQYQSYGLQIIEQVATEFSSTWRSSTISITWDFHLGAKKEFENVLLKQLMQLSLSTLSRLVTNSDLSSPQDQQVCDKFLRVASLVLCWNFSPKYLYLHFKILISALRTNSFRPPDTWQDLFQDSSIVTFFMQLHGRVRYQEQLCHNSLICLTQLASLMGDALGSGPIALVMPQIGEHGGRRLATSMSGTELEKRVAGGNKALPHDLYVQTFTRHLIDMFSNIVLDHEMASLSLVIYKLFTCHPIAIFERFPADLMRSFIEFVVANILKLTEPAMSLALQKNDQTFHEPLANLFQVWRSILRSTYAFPEDVANFIASQNPRILESFLKAVLATPFGNRSKPSTEEIFDENEEEEDDRQVFMDLLCDVGFFALYSIDFFTEYISSVLVQRLRELRDMDLSSCTQEQLRVWQEDFHWLLLVIGYFIRQPSYSNVGNYPEELAMRCLGGYKTGEYVKMADWEPIFSACIASPPFDPNSYPGLDPIAKISTQILSWFSMEHQMLVRLDSNAPLLSPALCQTSLWQFSLMMIVLTPPHYPGGDLSNVSAAQNEDDENLDAREDDLIGSQLEDMKSLPSISGKSALSAQIIQMALEKLFAILTKMAGEKRLCADVIDLMINFAEYRAEELATNEHLYSLLAGLNIENLPSRRAFIKSLVLIGSTVESEDVRQKMHFTILQPLLERFLMLSENPAASADSQLSDYFECFAGVADAGQSDTANTLFRYLQPVFQQCVPLISKRSDSQLLIYSILEFIKSSTDVLFFYVESQEETFGYHQMLISIINAYKETQLHRFRDRTFVAPSREGDDDDQQTQDLSTLIEILCLFQSKTYLPIIGNEGSAVNSAKISLLGLEMLLPLMSEELLKVPVLCASFFRLLIFVSDIAPEAVVQCSPQMLTDFLRCVGMALDGVFGIERVRSSLEIVTNLASYCTAQASKTETKMGLSRLMAEQLLALTPKVLELAMEYSCEIEIFNEATSALYSLLSFNRDSFSSYIHQLLSLQSNQDNKPSLEAAFRKLMCEEQSERPYSASRKRQFQIRFQDFLVEVSGTLCLN